MRTLPDVFLLLSNNAACKTLSTLDLMCVASASRASQAKRAQVCASNFAFLHRRLGFGAFCSNCLQVLTLLGNKTRERVSLHSQGNEHGVADEKHEPDHPLSWQLRPHRREGGAKTEEQEVEQLLPALWWQVGEEVGEDAGGVADARLGATIDRRLLVHSARGRYESEPGSHEVCGRGVAWRCHVAKPKQRPLTV